MDKFLKLTEIQRLKAIEEAALIKNIESYIVEKDFWVCWILKKLFSIEEIASHVIFKGGTSLSKCYGVIERFSEDCDMTINRNMLPNIKDTDEQGISHKEQQRRVENIVYEAQNYVKEVILPILYGIMEEELGNGFTWKLELAADELTIYFYYPIENPRETKKWLCSIEMREKIHE